MAIGPVTGVIQQLRRVVLGKGSGPTDGQLLERFLACREEEAFEALVRRHGPMVLGVCRRVLHHAQDAEDAFQATFLVLVRKADSIRPRHMVGNWLYGVAQRTALKAKTMNARRREKEAQVSPRPGPEEPALDPWEDFQPVLDRELTGLPEKYRALIVLCDLEGRPRKEAARHLGLTEGTVSSRLARGRNLLGRRLRRHQLALPAGLLAALLAREGAAATLPLALLGNTVKAAAWTATSEAAAAGVISARVAALTEGVVRAMLLTKLKIALFLLLTVGLLSLGGLWTAPQALADKPPAKGPAKTEGKKDKNSGKFVKKVDDRQAQGTVRALDASKKTITIGNKQDDRTFTLAADVRVILPEGKKGQVPNPSKDKKEKRENLGQLSDVKEGMEVLVQLAADKKTVQAIAVRLPQRLGTIKAVDAAKHTLTLFSKGKEGGGESTFTVGLDVFINLPGAQKGQSGKFSDLAPGLMVTMELSLDQSTPRRIMVHLPTIHGSVTAVDAAKGTITLQYKDMGGRQEKTFLLGKDVPIQVDDVTVQKGSAADLIEDVNVIAQLSLDNKKLVAITLPGWTYNGTLKGVDPASRTITLTVKENGGLEDLTFDVPAKAGITMTAGKKNRDILLRDLVQDSNLTVRVSLDRKRALAIHALDN